MHAYPTDPHGIIFRHAALEHGHTDNQLARSVAGGQISRIWPGAYLPSPEEPLKPTELHRLTAIAAGIVSDGSSALSHESAALMHGMSLLHPRLDHVHFATGLRTGGRIDNRRHIHSGALESDDVVEVDGIQVTSLARTAADLARSQSFAVALAAIDSALRLGADREMISDALAGHRRGVTHARLALTHADPGAENAGESWGRAQIIAAGLPIPRLQHKFYNHDGEFVARCDYDWLGKLAGEFDGMAKYQRHLKPGETPFDAMRREKKREDALRRLGVMVIRWIWDDLRKNKVVPMVREWLDHCGIAA